MKQPWDKRKGETAPAFEAFVLYRDMGPKRSLEKAASRVGKTKQMLGRWSSEHDWQDRTAAWDEYLDRRVQEDNAHEHLEMNRRHGQLARMLQGKVVERLQGIDVDAIKPADLARIVDVAVRIERLAAGAATDIAAFTDLDLSKLDDKELADLEKLTEKASPV